MSAAAPWAMVLAVTCALAGAASADEPPPTYPAYPVYPVYSQQPGALVVIPPGSYVPSLSTPPPERPADPMAGASGFVFRGELTATYRYALRESWAAGGAQLYLGGEHGRLGLAGTLAVDGGRSEAGLSFMTLLWGFELAGRVTERLRLGVNPHFGVIAIQDATDGEWNMSAFMLGVTIDATYDIVRRKGRSFYAVVKAGVDYIDVSADSAADQGALGTDNYAASMSVSAGLGCRL